MSKSHGRKSSKLSASVLLVFDFHAIEHLSSLAICAVDALHIVASNLEPQNALALLVTSVCIICILRSNVFGFFAFIHCCSLLFAFIHFYSLLFTFIHFLFTFFCSLLFTLIHFYSLLWTFVHFCSLLFIVVHFYSLLFTVVHFCSLLFTFIHCCSLLFTVMHFYSLLFTFVHCCSLSFTFLLTLLRPRKASLQKTGTKIFISNICTFTYVLFPKNIHGFHVCSHNK